MKEQKNGHHLYRYNYPPFTQLAPRGAFLGLTFGLTYLLDLVIYLRGGLSNPWIGTILQLQMLLPAFSAIVLGLFFFPESPIYYRRPAGRGRWYYYYFLAADGILRPQRPRRVAVPTPGHAGHVAPVAQILAFLGLLVLIVLRFAAGREGMARVGLTWANWRYFLVFGLAFIVYYVVQAALNAALGLGPASLAPIPALPGFSPTLFLIVGGVQSVLLAPILAISSPSVRSTAGADICKASCSSWAGCAACCCWA